MGVQDHGRVLWLKAMDGRPDHDAVIGANSRAPGMRTHMERMGWALEKCPDVLAIYLKQRPNPKYHRAGKPGTVVGFVRLGSLEVGETVETYAYDSRFDIGWPLAKTHCSWRDLESLREMLQWIYGHEAPTRWGSLCGSMTGGRPVDIVESGFTAVSDALTGIYRAIYA